MPADHETIRIWGVHGSDRSGAVLPVPRSARRGRPGPPVVRRQRRRSHRAQLPQPPCRVLRDPIPRARRAARPGHRLRWRRVSPRRARVRQEGPAPRRRIAHLQRRPLDPSALRSQRRRGRPALFDLGELQRRRQRQPARHVRPVLRRSRQPSCTSAPAAAEAGATRSTARPTWSGTTSSAAPSATEAARAEYGVVLTGEGHDLAVDEAGTEELREQMRSERGPNWPCSTGAPASRCSRRRAASVGPRDGST